MPKLGYKQSKEHSEKIRNINILSYMNGRKIKVPCNIGIKHTETSKQNYSQAQKTKMKNNEIREKIRNSLKGHAVSISAREKMRVKRIGKWNGKNNPRWSGGNSETRYNDKSWEIKRKTIYKRDNYTCQCCGKKNIILHAHHIVPYRITKDDSNENLITLCASCHLKLEKQYYKKGV